MTLGGGLIIGGVVAGILAGFIAFFVRLYQSRIRWALADYLGLHYFAQDRDFPVRRLVSAVNLAVGCLLSDARWTKTQITDALRRDFYVYVFADDEFAGKPGIAGYEANGVLGVNRKLTTLCHELGHMLQERIEGAVDFEHAHFEVDGINKAERAYLRQLVDIMGVVR